MVDRASCFGQQVTQWAFSNRTNRFKTSYAYMWGLLRMSHCALHVAHIDNDYSIVYPRPTPPPGLDWVATAVELLARNDHLLSVHPAPHTGVGPASRRPDCWLNSTAACVCVNTNTCAKMVDGGRMNSFKDVRQLEGTNGSAVCGHTVNALRGGGRHFSFQAWVADATRFVRMWPFKSPTIHIESIIDHLNVQHGLEPLWLPPSVVGWKWKLDGRAAREAFTDWSAPDGARRWAMSRGATPASAEALWTGGLAGLSRSLSKCRSRPHFG